MKQLLAPMLIVAAVSGCVGTANIVQPTVNAVADVNAQANTAVSGQLPVMPTPTPQIIYVQGTPAPQGMGVTGGEPQPSPSQLTDQELWTLMHPQPTTTPVPSPSPVVLYDPAKSYSYKTIDFEFTYPNNLKPFDPLSSETSVIVKLIPDTGFGNLVFMKAPATESLEAVDTRLLGVSGFKSDVNKSGMLDGVPAYAIGGFSYNKGIEFREFALISIKKGYLYSMSGSIQSDNPSMELLKDASNQIFDTWHWK